MSLTHEQILEFTSTAAELRSRLPQIQTLAASIQTIQTENEQLRQHVNDLRRSALYRATAPAPNRVPGSITDDCARFIAAILVAHCEKSGTLDALCPFPAQRDAILTFARNTLNLTTRAALTTTDIPLPAQYGGEIRELISDFGVIRRRMSPYPIGMGTARPARMGTRVAFGSIAMSAPLAEKSPSFGFASLESHKIGGIVRVPREIDEQSIVPMGQFLARYGAIEFARAEDTWGFLADGGPDVEQVKGLVTVATENDTVITLPQGKTSPSDVTLDDLRALRRPVNRAALNGRLSAYYLDTTWETRLLSFKTAADPNCYVRLPDGSATLDGYPVVWTDVLTPYGTDPAPNKPMAVFGALSFWWFGEHGTPRVDTSRHVWFENDQLAVRFIEEIDFDYAAADAVSALKTASE